MFLFWNPFLGKTIPIDWYFWKALKHLGLQVTFLGMETSTLRTYRRSSFIWKVKIPGVLRGYEKGVFDRPCKFAWAFSIDLKQGAPVDK